MKYILLKNCNRRVLAVFASWIIDFMLVCLQEISVISSALCPLKPHSLSQISVASRSMVALIIFGVCTSLAFRLHSPLPSSITTYLSLENVWIDRNTGAPCYSDLYSSSVRLNVHTSLVNTDRLHTRTAGQNNEENSAFALNVDGIDNEKFMKQIVCTVVHRATVMDGNSNSQCKFGGKHERLLYFPPFCHSVHFYGLFRVNLIINSNNTWFLQWRPSVLRLDLTVLFR